MAIKITLDSFLAVLIRSNLLLEEQVTSALEKFRAAQPNAGVDAKPFAEFLVRNKVLTVWQAEKVLQGKHKGFFLGRYRLLSLLGKGGMSSVYLAEHTVMKRHCALKVLPAKRVNDATLAPSRASVSTMALPIPRLPPVTRATLPASFMVFSVLHHVRQNVDRFSGGNSSHALASVAVVRPLGPQGGVQLPKLLDSQVV